MTHLINPNCDGAHCRLPFGEVRVLPTGASGNVILCRGCFEYELAYRKERNRDLSPDCRFDIPTWTSLKVYPEVQP